MKALVVGSSGLVGGSLLGALERGGIEAVGSYHSRPLNGTVQMDLRDKASVASCLEEVRADVIFLAVNTSGGADFCERNPEEAHALNVLGTQNVVDVASQNGTRIVYYSSDYVFDGTAGPYNEDDEPNPVNVYGRTKVEAERIIRASDPNHLILRTTAVFGWERTSPNFAMQVWDRLQSGNTMQVPDDQVCNPTLEEYLAEVSVRLVQLGATGTFNVVGKERIPRSDLGRILARSMALDPDLIIPTPTAELQQVAPRPLEAGLNTAKLAQTLDTQPMEISEALKRFSRRWRTDTYSSYGPKAVSTEAEILKQEILEKTKRYYDLVHNQSEFIPHRTRVKYAGRVFGEEELVNLVDCSLDFWLTLGPYGDLFENKMKRVLGVKDFAVVNSGSTANLTAVMALMSHQMDEPLKPGDEVITPAVTFPTTLSPIVHSGLIPVFVDCEVGTYNIDPNLLEAAISNKTRAIMIPHTLGVPCDMDVIVDLVKQHSLYLIEDSCDALGSTFRGQQVGTFGDLSTYSFFPAHHITMGEGGGVAVNNYRLARIVRSIRDWGRDCWCAPGESNTCGKRFGWQLGDLPKGYDHKFTYSNIGFNFKPTDMQAAIGVAQLDRLPEFISRRRQNFSRLYKGLEHLQDHLILPTMDPRSDPSWFGFTITVKESLSRHELVQWLENAKIDTREIFAGNILKQPAYRNINHRISGTLDATDRIMSDSFFIGVYPGMTDQMTQFMIDTIDEGVNKLARKP